ncbi:hypothetical protein ThidrDRAFT_1102 [Thiorhodococcus drewsii AZ1]|uniref:Uncharacterized protein n=1 Tax=Thiorhodococcus drewsii AZ1 TaxID=765913 RepID=G2DYJ0_9GAMM|nr:hypothetical protein ThidrDRAFT_1102 [Thiorhodococcus drewsii AZ1]
MFQSLFYWISRCGGVSFLKPSTSLWSFNPCSIGLAVAAETTEVVEVAWNRFQSLFYWISRCG